MNLMLLLEMAAQAAPDRIAIGNLSDGLTYERLYELSGRAARHIREAGHDRVLYTDVSTPMLPVAVFGAAWGGVPFVPLNYRLADDRLRMLIERKAPGILLHGPNDRDRIGEVDGLSFAFTAEMESELGNVDASDADWSMDGDDVAIELHTSGTSGDPKVAILRQKHLVSYVLGSVEFLGADEDEATLVSVPPYHIAGMSAILTATYGGRRLVQLPAFEPALWVETARREKITHAMVVPTMLARILEVLRAEGSGTEGIPSLRHLSYGGGRMPVPVIEEALDLLPGVNFVNAYGLTETSSSITILGPDDHRLAITSDDPAIRARLGSVGQPLPTIELSIRDPEGNEVPNGERGEVWCRGEQVSGEYGGKSVLNDEGWFPTKDAGYLDAEGYLYLDGRLDDVIVRGGENLSPGEIEDVLLQHESIRDACVFGLPDREWGEVVGACVVLEDGHKMTADDVRAWVVKNLRSSRVPSVVDFRPELPYGDTGKVLRRVLKAELAEG